MRKLTVCMLSGALCCTRLRGNGIGSSDSPAMLVTRSTSPVTYKGGKVWTGVGRVQGRGMHP